MRNPYYKRSISLYVAKIFRKRNHGFHRWARIKTNTSNDPFGIGRDKDDGDLLKKDQRENEFLLQEDCNSDINETNHSLMVNVDP